MLSNNTRIGLNDHGENCVFSFVDDGKFVDISIELGKSGIEIQSLFAKQENENSGVIMEEVGPYVIE